MSEDTDTKALLDAAKQIMNAAGCASLVTLDESGLPSSRPVRTFPSDDEFTEITIPTDLDSRKTHHVRKNGNIVLSYVDGPSRAYVTMIGRAVLSDRLEDKMAAWKEPFSAFWPDGPESHSYLLIQFKPERIELRSYTQGVAEEPTRWTPITMERTDSGDWRLVI